MHPNLYCFTCHAVHPTMAAHVMFCLSCWQPDEFQGLKLDCNNLETVWALADVSFMHHAKCVVKFVKRIPGENLSLLHP